MEKITVIFTCFNRKEKTLACINSLLSQNDGLDFHFVIVDDNSSDGTPEMLEKLKAEGLNIDILHGDGNLYWAGGMRRGIAAVKEAMTAKEGAAGACVAVREQMPCGEPGAEYVLLVNDDVKFDLDVVKSMVADSDYLEKRYGKTPVMVGPMRDENGNFSYGGIRYQKGIHYEVVRPEDEDRRCDSFNMNCLLLSKKTFLELPNFDAHYVHSLADFDYGLEMKRRQIPMYVTSYYAGTCPDNDPKGGWTDRSLPRRERLKKKENIKGAPFKPWFYFLRKNFGMGQALLHAFTPYLRILLGK